MNSFANRSSNLTECKSSLPESLQHGFNQYIHLSEWGKKELKKPHASQAYEASGVSVAAEIILLIGKEQLMKGVTNFLLSYNRYSLDEYHYAQTGSAVNRRRAANGRRN